MSLRIAFCGPDLAMNTTLMEKAYELIGDQVSDYIMLEHPVEEIVARTGKTSYDSGDIDWLNLWANMLRRMDMEAVRDRQLVMAASCGVDQVALQAAKLADDISKIPPTLLGPDGSALENTEVNSAINRTGAVMQVITNSAEEEIVDFWDFVYAVVPASVEMGEAPDGLLVQYQDFLDGVPAFIEEVKKLPANEDAAVDGLKNEVILWKQTLVS